MRSRRLAVILSVMSLVLGFAGDAAARIAVHPTSVQGTATAGSRASTILHVTNLGPASPLGYTITETTSWLSAAPSSGSIVAGDTVDVTVSFDATALIPGVYTATMTVNDPHHGPFGVPVTLTVEANPGTGVGAPGAGEAPRFALGQNMPNPATTMTTIGFELAASARVRLDLYDVTGREVAVLIDAELAPGEHLMGWDTSALTRGVYFYRITAADFSATRRMVVQ